MSENLSEEILKQHLSKQEYEFFGDKFGNLKKALDTFFECRSMVLLEYLAKNHVECFVESSSGECVFWGDSGEYLTKEQLFHNFFIKPYNNES